MGAAAAVVAATDEEKLYFPSNKNQDMSSQLLWPMRRGRRGEKFEEKRLLLPNSTHTKANKRMSSVEFQSLSLSLTLFLEHNIMEVMGENFPGFDSLLDSFLTLYTKVLLYTTSSVFSCPLLITSESCNGESKSDFLKNLVSWLSS